MRSFVPPLIIWTFVAMFIFNMQFLWKYIDDIIGKGLDLSIILELLFYQSLAMIPRAMVFGVLIAAVMTLGNLAEHYELVAMKSAGISLVRVMTPLLFFAFILATTSFIFSDQFIPNTALKFKATLHDIRRQKPALSFEEGQFNNDFQKVAIFVEKKAKNGKVLEGLKIYEHTTPGYKGHINAEKGGLFYTKDTIHQKINSMQKDSIVQKDTVINRSFLVVELSNGVRYEELDPEPKRPMAYPHIELRFKTYTTLFDMSEFEFNQTNEDVFKGHYSLLSTRQLLKAVDSLYKTKAERYAMLKRNCDAVFQFRREGLAEEGDTTIIPPNRYAKHYYPSPWVHAPKIAIGASPKSFVELIPKEKRDYIYQRAVGFCQNIKGQAGGVKDYIKNGERVHAEHENEIHQKFSFALACLLFLFIGAPMGAIIRKGGFGWPILVAFIFFMSFFVLFLIGERLAISAAVPCWVGSWLPNLVLLPFGILLTYKALNDSRVISFEQISGITKAVKKLLGI